MNEVGAMQIIRERSGRYMREARRGFFDGIILSFPGRIGVERHGRYDSLSAGVVFLSFPIFPPSDLLDT